MSLKDGISESRATSSELHFFETNTPITAHKQGNSLHYQYQINGINFGALSRTSRPELIQKSLFLIFVLLGIVPGNKFKYQYSHMKVIQQT